MGKDKSDKIDELRWVRVFSPVHIPHYLVEQVRDRDYTIENFFKHQELNCLVNGRDGPTLNPYNHLYVLADEKNIVKGFLWFIIEGLTQDIFINTFSMDKEYWGKGKAVKRLVDHMSEIIKKLKVNKVFWLTNYPKHSERYGFKRSCHVLMEYKEKEDGKNNDRINREGERSAPTDKTATRIHKSNAGTAGS